MKVAESYIGFKQTHKKEGSTNEAKQLQKWIRVGEKVLLGKEEYIFF